MRILSNGLVAVSAASILVLGVVACSSAGDGALAVSPVESAAQPAAANGDAGPPPPPSLGASQDAATCKAGDPAVNGGCGTCEICGDGIDNDCNGSIDEGCACTSGATERCFPGPPASAGTGACGGGTSTCGGGEFGHWGACVGAEAGAEVCDNGKDDDCDGLIDEGCCTDVPASAQLDPNTALNTPMPYTITAPATLYPGRQLSVQLVSGGWDDCGTLGSFTSSCAWGVAASFGGPPTDIVSGLTRSVDGTVTNLIAGGCGYSATLRWCNPEK